jgi:hypothetical protein
VPKVHPSYIHQIVLHGCSSMDFWGIVIVVINLGIDYHFMDIQNSKWKIWENLFSFAKSYDWQFNHLSNGIHGWNNILNHIPQME